MPPREGKRNDAKSDEILSALANDVAAICTSERYNIVMTGRNDEESAVRFLRMTAVGPALHRRRKIDLMLVDHASHDDVQRAIELHRPSKIRPHVNEVWIVGNTIRRALDRQQFGLGVRVSTVHNLRNSLRHYEPAGADQIEREEHRVVSTKKATPRTRSTKKTTPRTSIGKAITNKEQIMVAIAALFFQVDRRIEELQAERPNSEEGVQKRDQELRDVQWMRQQLEHLAKMVVEFNKGRVSEPRAANAFKAFAKQIDNWWAKDSRGF